jgi:hypothetical protein
MCRRHFGQVLKRQTSTNFQSYRSGQVTSGRLVVADELSQVLTRASTRLGITSPFHPVLVVRVGKLGSELIEGLADGARDVVEALPQPLGLLGA